ncbi:MAG: plasmid replication initiator [Robiginitomaculum sp.]|nr:MAG: plasmid replication initiator [Robiginitomaculum sp.]
MVTDTPNSESQLIPERHAQMDLFICDVSDAILKDVMAQMEHPFYSLSKKPETTIRRYENGNNWLEIIPSVKGLATIYDKDILIYCISQIMHKLKNNEPVSKRVRINTRDLLIFTNRGTAGKDYKALVEALERIRGTTISTNIRTGDEEQIDTFGLIESSSIRRKHGLDGRLLWCDVTLSDWVFNAIEAKEVLTLHRDYFRLRKPIERRVYELARKHCGQQPEFRIGLDKLHKKSGSQSPEKRFRQMIKHLVEHDHLPDYHVRYQSSDDMVIFINRDTMPKDKAPAPFRKPLVDPDIYPRAVEASGGWDKYILENAWQAYCVKNEITVRNPEAHFLDFCRKYHKTHGSA